MSLLKLKSKTEPLYTNKKIINYDEKINKEIIESAKTIKENSSLIIGEELQLKVKYLRKMKLPFKEM